MPLSAPATILTLQRGAGNAAVSRLLQRCGSGGCTCGGTCAESDPKEVDYRAAMTASVMVKSALNRAKRRDEKIAKAKAATRGPERLVRNDLQTRGPPRRPAGNEIQTRNVKAVLERAVLQRDFAIRPPRPDAVGRTLTAPQVQAALRFNNRVVAVIGADGIRTIRDVLGVSPEPAVIDEDFVNAVVRWQAVYRLGQDGQLGPASARLLFREFGAEGIARGEVDVGPRYTPTGTIAPPVVAGAQQANFRMRADFAHDPANGIYASCCEIRQHIRWDAASAAAMGGPPHAGFPAATAADTWVEDRDAANNRYGHRTGPNSDPQDFDQYIDTNLRRNQAFGHLYRGSDSPGGPAAGLGGSWRFMLSVIDVCNGNARIGGQDFVRVNW